MVQLGLSLQRLITTMTDHHDPEIPLLLSKLDIKDLFWCMDVSDEDAYNFCYVLPLMNPVDSIDDIEILSPNSL